MNALVVVPALCLTGLSAAAQQQDTSQQQTGDAVADAARKARESKKDAPKPKKIITDEDLKKSTPQADAGASPTPRNAGETASATTQAAGDATKDDDPNGETAWRKRFQDHRDQIAKAEKELDILGREAQKAQVEYYPDPQKAMTQQNSRADVNAINAKIDAKKKELDQLRQGLDDLVEQLRKSGGNPGWAR